MASRRTPVAGPKVGQDVGGRATTATTRTFDPDIDCLDRVETFLARHLPGAGRRAGTKTCLYTLTPDRDFVIDRVPGHPGIVVALGAAHGYKFAALFGRLLADLALDPDPAASGLSDTSLFAFGRPALKAPAETNLVANAVDSRANRVARRLAACEPSAATHDATAGTLVRPQAWRRSHAIALRRPSRPVHRRRASSPRRDSSPAWSAPARKSS